MACLVAVAGSAPSRPADPGEAAWRGADELLDVRWQEVRKSMPCKVFDVTAVDAQAFKAAEGWPRLLRNLNWTDLQWWGKRSFLKKLGHAPTLSGNYSELRYGPVAGELQSTTLKAVFSAADMGTEDLNGVFDPSFVNDKKARTVLQKWLWLEQSLAEHVDFVPDHIFMSALPSGHRRGVGVHQHGFSASALAVGRKLWVLAPPDSEAMHHQVKYEDDHRLPEVWEWARGGALPEGFEGLPAPSVCAQDTGEVMFLPEEFYHGTVPVGDAIGISFVERVVRAGVNRKEL